MNTQIIEVSKISKEIRVVEAKPNQSVYIAEIDNARVLIKGKCIKVVILDSKNSFVGIQGVISNVEIIRVKNSSVFLGQGSMINVEQCTECLIGTSAPSAEIRLRRNVGVSFVEVPLDKEEEIDLEGVEEEMLSQKEQYLPEEIKVTYSGGKLSYSIGDDMPGV